MRLQPKTHPSRVDLFQPEVLLISYLPDHHRNWNQLALQRISTDIKKNLHYSSVVSISAKDQEHIKEIFMRAIEESKKKVKASDGEKIFATTLNFFEIC